MLTITYLKTRLQKLPLCHNTSWNSEKQINIRSKIIKSSDVISQIKSGKLLNVDNGLLEKLLKEKVIQIVTVNFKVIFIVVSQ